MTQIIRSAFAAVLLIAGPAVAQTAPAREPARPVSTTVRPAGAAATLPNAFEGAEAAGPARLPAPAPATAPAQVAEATLRTVIGQFAAGDIDEALFTADVANRLNANITQYRTLIRGFGAVESVEAQAAADGVGEFVVIFENAATQWQVGLDDEGRIAALRFRESPPESSEPPAPGR